jgi:hypothetical protein
MAKAERLHSTPSPLRALTSFDALPPAHRTFRVDDDASAPHLTIGEYAVIDTTDTELQNGELYLIQYGGIERTRCVVQIKADELQITERGRPQLVWWVRDLSGFRQVGDELGGIPLLAGLSDGPYRGLNLKKRLLGRVVGYSVSSLGGLLTPRSEAPETRGRLEVTSVTAPLRRGTMWSGTARDDSSQYEWFYEPRGRFSMMRQEPRMPTCWMNCRPPDGARRAVVRAVRSARV